jgi:hypothetical protein
VCKDIYRNEIQRVLAEQMTQDATSLDEKLAAKHLLACSHRESGNTEASNKCFKEIIETTMRVFGEDRFFSSHLVVDAVFSMSNYANKSGHQEEAFGWLNCVDRGIQNGAIERSLVESNQVHGFATIYDALGQFDRALPYVERGVQLSNERGKSDGDTLACEETYGQSYSRQYLYQPWAARQGIDNLQGKSQGS